MINVCARGCDGYNDGSMRCTLEARPSILLLSPVPALQDVVSPLLVQLFVV